MLKLIGILLTGVLTSFYLFPLEFYFLPKANTKMIMALFGLIIFVYKNIGGINKTKKTEMVYVYILAVIVSFCALFSNFFNNTYDYTFTTYFISFMVWISAAYVVCFTIFKLHKKVNVPLVCYYLIGVCFIQCLLAVIIDHNPTFASKLNTYVVGFGSMHSAGSGISNANRLYGIGAALDVAGTRFAPILAICCYFLKKELGDWKKNIIFFSLFCTIFIIGCMISRTTIVGFVISITYFILSVKKEEKKSLALMGVFLIITSVMIIYLYRNNNFVYENLRFGFEPLFNYFEYNEISSTSTNELKEMIIFPDNFKTWMVGDGYMFEPFHYDPYYTGIINYDGSFYKGTDIGYLRYIFYFGLLGLISFISFFIYNTRICINRFPRYKFIFFILLLSNFIIWFKVSTDIFCLFALFLCIDKEDETDIKKTGRNCIGVENSN